MRNDDPSEWDNASPEMRVMWLWEGLVGHALSVERRAAFLARPEVKRLALFDIGLLTKAADTTVESNESGNLLLADWIAWSEAIDAYDNRTDVDVEYVETEFDPDAEDESDSDEEVVEEQESIRATFEHLLGRDDISER